MYKFESHIDTASFPFFADFFNRVPLRRIVCGFATLSVVAIDGNVVSYLRDDPGSRQSLVQELPTIAMAHARAA